MTLKDFTPTQAARWIDQEFAKVAANNAAERVTAERNAIALSRQYGLAEGMPNSMAAHEGLIQRISEAYL